MLFPFYESVSTPLHYLVAKFEDHLKLELFSKIYENLLYGIVSKYLIDYGEREEALRSSPTCYIWP